MYHTIFGQAKRNNGGQYGKPGEDKRNNDIKAYVEAGLFHWIIILVPKIMLGGLRPGSLKARGQDAWRPDARKLKGY
jgi:hypothetical protein